MARRFRCLRQGTISAFGLLALLGFPAFSVLFMATAFGPDALSGDVPWAWFLAFLAEPACLFLIWLSGTIALVTLGEGFWALPLFLMLVAVGFCFLILCLLTRIASAPPAAPMSGRYVIFLFGMLGLNLGVVLPMLRFIVRYRSDAFPSRFP